MLDHAAWFALRRALSAASSVCVVLLVQYYLEIRDGWMLFSAFFVCQTTLGTPVKRSVNVFFVLALIAILWPPYTMAVVKQRLMAVSIGAIIGMIAGQLFLPRRVFRELSQGLQPIFQALVVDMRQLIRVLQEDTESHRQALLGVTATESVLSHRNQLYPEWVYEVGFNPGLRNGYRFFLLHIERLSELMFSLNDLFAQVLDVPEFGMLQADLLVVMQANENLVISLQAYFASEASQPLVFAEDLVSDMQALEQALQQFIPGQLVLLDIAPEYLLVTALVRDLKDVREVLLQLMMALPARESLT